MSRNYDNVLASEYGQFLRRDFLKILDDGEIAGVQNHIFTDFHRHLQLIEMAVQRYRVLAIPDWDDAHNLWKGFYTLLQEHLTNANWNYVSNKRGGFVSLSWHWSGDKYLQLEHRKLCFKLHVPDIDAASRMKKRADWHNALMAESRATGFGLIPSANRLAKWMTVAYLKDYRLPIDGLLDIDKTVEKLRQAESLMDAAVRRLASPTPNDAPL